MMTQLVHVYVRHIAPKGWRHMAFGILDDIGTDIGTKPSTWKPVAQ